MKCVATGVKHLHHAAEHYDVGVYFEANGHGTVLFSPDTLHIFQTHQPSTPAQSTGLNHLINLTQLINQTVGDALSDMLLVEVVLAHKSYSGAEWDSLYVDLPNRLVKVVVPDRSIFKTEDAERRLVSPPGLQSKIDDLRRRYEAGRAFVRPSGTEDVVRVYAEAQFRPQADGKISLWHLLLLSLIDLVSQSLLIVLRVLFMTRSGVIHLSGPTSLCEGKNRTEMKQRVLVRHAEFV